MANQILFLAIPALVMTSTAMAAPLPEPEAMLDNKTALSDDELGDIRGGFLTAGGAQFDFGASIKTMVNGELALQTSLQWTDAGAVTKQLSGLGQSIRSNVNNIVASNLAQAGVASPVGSNAAGSNASDVTSNAASNMVQQTSAAASTAAAAPLAAAATAATPTTTPTATATNTPAPAAAGTPAIVTGVQVPGAGGSTQVLANLSPTQIQSIIMNSASGQNITQNTDITFTIYNFQAWQQQLAQHTLSAQLASDMLAASGFAAGH